MSAPNTYEVVIEGKRFRATRNMATGHVGSMTQLTATGEVMLWDAGSGRGSSNMDVRRVLLADPAPSSYSSPGRG